MARLSAFLGIAVLSLAAGASAKSDTESGDRELATSSYSYLFGSFSYEYDFELMCEPLCFGETCDYWGAGGYACGTMEASYGCDCGGCACECDLTCYGLSCDGWAMQGNTCDFMESYGCNCQGCDCAPPPENDADVCSTNSDTACGATDPYGDGCDYYIAAYVACGSYDSEDFSAFDMCCACGGGIAGAHDCSTDGDYDDQPPSTPADFCFQRRLKETDPFSALAVSKKAAQQPKRPDVFKHAAAVQQKRQSQATSLEPRHLQAGLSNNMGSSFSYSFDFLHGMMSYSYDDCTPSYGLLTCEDGSLMMGQDCDETCSSCAGMFDLTAYSPAGTYWCDDDYYYVDQDLDGTSDGAAPLTCYSDGCMMGDDDDDGECYPSQMSMTCDAGSIVMHDQCDETCSSCGVTFDLTAMSPAGMYWCDDGYFYYDEDLDGMYDESHPLDLMSCYWNDCGGSYSYSYSYGVPLPACAITCDSCDDVFVTECMQCEQGTEDWMWVQEMCCDDSDDDDDDDDDYTDDCFGTCESCKDALTTDCFTCAEASDGWQHVQVFCCNEEEYSYGFNPFAYRPCPAQAVVSTTMGMGGLTCADYGSEEEATTNAAIASLVDGVGEEHIGDHVCTDVSRRVRGRGLLTDEVSLAFDITVTESTTDDDGALVATDLATSISTQIATVASSGALQSTIVANAPADSALVSATVSTVETVATTSYTNAPTSAPTASAVTVSNTTLVLEASAVSNMRVSMVVGALTVVIAALLQA